MGFDRQIRQHRGHRAAPPRVPSKDFCPPPSTVGNIAGGAGAVQGQCCGEGRCPALATAPPHPFLGRSLLTDKHRFFLRHKVLVQPSTQSGSIIRWGTERRGRGGGRPPHNAHKWRVGPPLLCLGRKGRDPRRGPLNGSIVSEPPVPLGNPSVLSPPPAPAVKPPRLWSFWGPLFPSDTLGSAEGVLEGLSFWEQSKWADGCPPLPAPGRVVRGERGCWGQRELKFSPPCAVVLGDKKADLGQTKGSPPWQRVLGDGEHDQGHIWRGFAPIIRHRGVSLPTGSRQGLAPLPADAIPSANWDAGCSPGYNPWGGGAVRPPSLHPDGEVKQKPVPKRGPVWVPRAGFLHRGGCGDLEALRQAPAMPVETFAIPLKHRLGHVRLPSAAAGLVKMAQW
ncbi:uncharacterized protein ACIBXB_019831 [Morphnus guianensis]